MNESRSGLVFLGVLITGDADVVSKLNVRRVNELIQWRNFHWLTSILLNLFEILFGLTSHSGDGSDSTAWS